MDNETNSIKSQEKSYQQVINKFDFGKISIQILKILNYGMTLVFLGCSAAVFVSAVLILLIPLSIFFLANIIVETAKFCFSKYTFNTDFFDDIVLYISTVMLCYFNTEKRITMSILNINKNVDRIMHDSSVEISKEK
jgi:hypothetical protein